MFTREPNFCKAFPTHGTTEKRLDVRKKKWKEKSSFLSTGKKNLLFSYFICICLVLQSPPYFKSHPFLRKPVSGDQQPSSTWQPPYFKETEVALTIQSYGYLRILSKLPEVSSGKICSTPWDPNTKCTLFLGVLIKKNKSKQDFAVLSMDNHVDGLHNYHVIHTITCIAFLM